MLLRRKRYNCDDRITIALGPPASVEFTVAEALSPEMSEILTIGSRRLDL